MMVYTYYNNNNNNVFNSDKKSIDIHKIHVEICIYKTYTLSIKINININSGNIDVCIIFSGNFPTYFAL